MSTNSTGIASCSLARNSSRSATRSSKSATESAPPETATPIFTPLVFLSALSARLSAQKMPRRSSAPRTFFDNSSERTLLPRFASSSVFFMKKSCRRFLFPSAYPTIPHGVTAVLCITVEIRNEWLTIRLPPEILFKLYVAFLHDREVLLFDNRYDVPESVDRKSTRLN